MYMYYHRQWPDPRTCNLINQVFFLLLSMTDKLYSALSMWGWVSKQCKLKCSNNSTSALPM